MMMGTLVLLPTQLTRQRLQQMMQGSPVHIDWDAMHIELSDEVGPGVKPLNQEYVAKFESFGFYWDAARGRSVLVGVMESSQISERRAQLGGHAQQDILLIFNENAAAGFSNRSWIASMSTTLVVREGDFTFGPEHYLE